MQPSPSDDDDDDFAPAAKKKPAEKPAPAKKPTASKKPSGESKPKPKPVSKPVAKTKNKFDSDSEDEDVVDASPPPQKTKKAPKKLYKVFLVPFIYFTWLVNFLGLLKF